MTQVTVTNVALILHRSDRPDQLVKQFAELLQREPADVFSQEVVIVPAKGVERWLTQQLSLTLGAPSGRGGVCAGLEIMTPNSLVTLILGQDADDVWLPERLTWYVLAAIDECMGAPGFEVLTRHLGAEMPSGDPLTESRRQHRRTRRYSVAQKLARLFASYARERPDVLGDWESGELTDGGGAPLPDDLHWQALLWCVVVRNVRDTGLASESPSQRLKRVTDGLRDGTLEPGLPHRVSLFGHTRLAASQLALLQALAVGHEVHLWLPHPSEQLWHDLSSRPDGRGPRVTTLDENNLGENNIANPLLRALSRDARELQTSLAGLDAVDASLPTEHEAPRTRLAAVQADVRANREPSKEVELPPVDRSFQVHACHGPARQVEALREILLDLVDPDGGGLQPRDIIVMCPDIETFAPLLRATFGIDARHQRFEQRGDGHPGQQLRVQLADRSASASNPIIDAALRIIDLAMSRFTVSEVLDLAANEAVAHRFGFDDEALAVLTEWVESGSVRWGIDGEHRRDYGLRGVNVNTWQVGLDRLALGVAVSASSPSHAALGLPVDDVTSTDTELVGNFLEFVTRLQAAVEATRDEMDAAGWMTWLNEAVLGVVDTPADQRWQIANFTRDIARIGEAAGETRRLTLSEIKALAQARWAPRPSRSNFRTGAVTVCTMVPMRSVPHKAVIVLGWDDGVYPRSPIADGDDVLARRPLVGERDARSEDNQLVLDALMAAEEHFIVFYSGFDERSGELHPPASALAELIHTAAATGEKGESTRSSEKDATPAFVRAHPLQSFDERNFVENSPLLGGSFDAAGRTGAAALREFRAEVEHREQDFLPAAFSSPKLGSDAVTLDELTNFLHNPAREFVRHRLDVTIARETEPPSNDIPMAPNALELWKIGDRVLKRALSGGGSPAEVEAAMNDERERGELPPGVVGRQAAEEIKSAVLSILRSAQPQPSRSVEISIDLSGNRRLRGTINNIVGNDLHLTGYSRVGAKQQIAAWVQLLALAVHEGDRPHRAALYGKKSSRFLTAPEPEVAAQHLTHLIEYLGKNTQFPLGVPPKTASAFAKQLGPWCPGDDVRGSRHLAAMSAARKEWENKDFGERNDPWWELVHGKDASVEILEQALVFWGSRIWVPIHMAGGSK